VWGDSDVHDFTSTGTRPIERLFPIDPHKIIFEKINHFENAFQIKKLTNPRG